MVTLFVTSPTKQEWVVPVSEKAKLSDLIPLSLDNFRIHDNNDYHFSYLNDENKWVRALSSRRVEDLYLTGREGAYILRVRLDLSPRKAKR